MASDLIERLRAKDANWQELCNRWEAQAKENGAKDDELVAGFRTMRKTIEAESADELATLRTALAIEREGHAAARQNFHTMQLAADALRKRAERAEASLAEAKLLLQPFADARGYFDGHVKDEDLVYVALRNIRASHVRAAARFLAQEEGRPSPKGGPDHG